MVKEKVSVHYSWIYGKESENILDTLYMDRKKEGLENLRLYYIREKRLISFVS